MKLSTKEMRDGEAELTWSRAARVFQRNVFLG